MSRGMKQLAAFAAFVCVATPSAAFDTLSQQSPGVMFYFSIPLDAPKAKDETFSAGFAIQGKRDRGEMDHRRGRGRGGRGRGGEQGQVHHHQPAAAADPAGGGAAASAADRWWWRHALPRHADLPVAASI
jgi:hypothetical protein